MKKKAKNSDSAHFILQVFCWGISFVFVFFLFLLLLPLSITEPAFKYLLGVNDKKEAVQYMGLAASGLLIALGIWAANRRAKAMEENVVQTEIGHRQERFRDAITHLGDKSSPVRMGGIYALYHLAQEDESRRVGIAETLCSYIRENTQTRDYLEQYNEQPSVEIQSLLDLLFCRNLEDTKKLFQKTKINLSNTCLRGALLSNAHLKGANLRKAQLQRANLTRAQLQGADLIEAQLWETSLIKAQLQMADLTAAQLHSADLTEAQFQMANLTGAQFQMMALTEKQFQRTHLIKAQLQGAQLSKEQIRKIKPADQTIFSGGLQRDEVNEMILAMRGYVSDQKIETFETTMQKHIGKPPNYEMPQKSDTHS